MTLWFALATVGIATVMVLHLYGTGIVAQREIQRTLDRVQAALIAENPDDAQRLILQVLNQSPQQLDQVMDRFGMHLIAMPNVMSYLTSAHGGDGVGNETNQSMTRLQHEMLLSKNAIDPALMHIVQSDDKRDRKADLWLGYMAYDDADFVAAIGYFDRYWKDKEERAEAAGRTMGLPSSPREKTEAALRLLEQGLWPEAFELAGQSGAKDVNALFLRALQADLEGNATAAREAYAKVLEASPTHLLSIKRLARLE